MRAEIDLPAVIETALSEAEQRFGLTRAQIVIVCVVAGISELTESYVREILRQVESENEGDRT